MPAAMTVASSFQRARRPEHKHQRRVAILEAARQLACERGVQAVTLGDIAARASMAKSNVLRYFETREEVYLQLTLAAFAEWNSLVAEQLASAAMTPVQVADVLADTLAARPLLCDLFARVSSTLEHNVSPQLVREFKLKMLEHTEQLAELIARRGGQRVAGACLRDGRRRLRAGRRTLADLQSACRDRGGARATRARAHARFVPRHAAAHAGSAHGWHHPHRLTRLMTATGRAATHPATRADRARPARAWR